MKLILIALFLSTTAFASVPVTITFNVPSAAYLTDVETSRMNQVIRTSAEGTLTGSLTSGSTSMTISGLCPAANVAVLIDQEPILVTAGSGTTTCTITRNSALAQANTVAAAHSTGASVFELLYPSAQKYFILVGVQNFMVQVIQGLGTSSSVNGSTLSSILSSQATINAALSGTAQ